MLAFYSTSDHLYGSRSKEAMRKKFAFISGAFGIWAISSAAAFAFEQTPVAPAPAVNATAPSPAQSEAKFDGEAKTLGLQKKSGGVKIPGLGKLSVPKMNFGLDLMYGSPENDDADLGFTGESGGDNDLTILGKVKRRF